LEDCDGTNIEVGISINWVGSTALTDLSLMVPWLFLLKPGFFEVPRCM